MAKKARSNGSRLVKSARSTKPVHARKERGSAISGPKVRDSKNSRSTTSHLKSARAKATASLSDLPTEVLARELARRRSELPKLERQAADLRRQLAEIESRIAALGPGHSLISAAPRRGSRTGGGQPARGLNAPRRERKGAPTLGARLVAYLSAHPGIHPPGALAETIAAEMGRACTQSFIVSTNAALRKLIGDGAVEKVGRGQYRAKGSSDVATN